MGKKGPPPGWLNVAVHTSAHAEPMCKQPRAAHVRLYWLVVSPGVRLLRWVALRRAKRELDCAPLMCPSAMRYAA
jgi:hypothetical protein